MKTEMKHWTAGNVFVRRDDTLLSFGNSFYTRTIDLSGGFPRTVSLKSGEMEWAAEDKKGCDCSFFGINMARQDGLPSERGGGGCLPGKSAV